jgi:hypothetical protein
MSLAPVDASVTVRLVYRPEPVVIADTWATLEVDLAIVEYTIPATEELDEFDSPDPYTRTEIKGWPLTASGTRDKRAKDRTSWSISPESERLAVLAERFGIDPIKDAEALLAPSVFPSVDAAAD